MILRLTEYVVRQNAFGFALTVSGSCGKMACSFSVVEDKLLEAEFFLRKLGATDMHDSEARYYFSAFVSACRSVTWALQKSLKGVGGFDSWYESVREQLNPEDS